MSAQHEELPQYSAPRAHVPRLPRLQLYKPRADESAKV